MTRPYELPDAIPLEEQRGQTFVKLVEVMQRLLGEGGCPWDREQSIETLRPYVLEEACEVMDAIDSGDRTQLCEELGDLALQIVFHGELARAQSAFGPDDVFRGICEKLVRRHPHVFGDVEVAGADDVAKNWDAIKAEEKRGRGLLDGIPRSLPALARAHRSSEKAARVGFDWPDGHGSRAKVTEELAELDEAVAEGSRDRIEHELGDVLFALVNLARHHGIDPEAALRRTADKFASRFAHVERRVRERHGDWPRDEKGKPTRGLSLEELDGYWEDAKRTP
jgi:tetrapyrrole methylase family protein/MazG family protein/ATP diphosphatase